MPVSQPTKGRTEEQPPNTKCLQMVSTFKLYMWEMLNASFTHKKCKCFQGIFRNKRSEEMKLLTVTYKIPGKPLYLVIRKFTTTNRNGKADPYNIILLVQLIQNDMFFRYICKHTLTLRNFH